MFWIKWEPKVPMCQLEVQVETFLRWLSPSQLQFSFLSLLFISYLFILGVESYPMHCLGGQKEQLACAILERSAKDRDTWVTGDVKD